MRLCVSNSAEPQALHALCFTRLRRGEYALGVADCNAAVKVMPKEDLHGPHNDADTLYVRGLINIRLGYASLGNADIAAAKAIDPKIARTYAVYGVTP